MNLTSKREIKKILKKCQVRPSKRLGQNFLIDKKAIKRIIEAADLKPGDVVLEIGPGIGSLTQELAKRAKMVVAVEKDLKMTEILKETAGEFKNVKVVQGDILKIKSLKLKIKNYKIVANLPFYLTAPVIRKFLEIKNPPKEMVLVVQKEVGQRIAAQPPKMSVLAVSVQFYVYPHTTDFGVGARPKIVSYISQRSFWPQPKVDGAIIKITSASLSKKTAIAGISDRRELKDLFFRIVKVGFSQPRKKLINNLSTGLSLKRQLVENWLLENNIQPSQRAETLSIENWLNLTKSFQF